MMPTDDSGTDELRRVLRGSDDPEIVALEARLRAAQLRSDRHALEELLSEDLLFTGSDGEIASKADDVSSHAAGHVRFVRHDPEELRIRRIGENVAIIALRTRLVVVAGGATHRSTFRYTRVWARQPGTGWQVVGGHVSAVPGSDG